MFGLQKHFLEQHKQSFNLSSPRLSPAELMHPKPVHLHSLGAKLHFDQDHQLHWQVCTGIAMQMRELCNCTGHELG